MQNMTWRRVSMMLFGNLFIGLGIAVLRISTLGTDPFTTINLGISGTLDLSLGVYQVVFNIVLLAFVFAYYKESIGLGTLVNMVGIGFVSDFLIYGYSFYFEEPSLLAIRLLFMSIAVLVVSLGVALYIPAGLGMAPYDALAFVIRKVSKEKVSFPVARIMTDISCVAIGFYFGAIVGIATVILAFFAGPLIQFFRTRISEPFLAKERQIVVAPAPEQNAY